MIEDHLLALVVLGAVVGLVLPGVGTVLSGAITPLLALLMLAVALSFDVAALRAVLRRPQVQALATVLVYGPMSLLGHGLGRLVFGTAPLGLGFTLVGVLPTDVSSPLLVWLARGNVALATVLNAVNTALAPLLVPGLFLLFTGVALDVPVAGLVVELAVTILVPTAVGVALRTRYDAVVARGEAALSATASLSYVLLVVAVVGANADTIVAAPVTVAQVAGVALVLNLAGYLIGLASWPLLADRGERVAMLFTTSKKEFSIAAFVVAATGLPTEVALPAVVFAVVQMVTSPVVARLLARDAP